MDITKIISVEILSYYNSKLKNWVSATINSAISAITLTKDKITDLAALTSGAGDSDTGLWTGADKKKLDELVESGGEKNVIEIVKVNGSPLQVENKAVDVTVPTSLVGLDNSTTKYLSESEVDSKIAQAVAQAVTYKGSVDTVEQLPQNAKNGDMYNVKSDDINRVWDGEAWDKYATIPFEEAVNSDIDALFA